MGQQIQKPADRAPLITGFSSQIGTKLRDWAVWQAGAGCSLEAALSSNDSKTLYFDVSG